MRMKFSTALELGSIVFKHGRGGLHLLQLLDAGLCAIEAALAAVGLKPTINSRHNPLGIVEICNYEGAYHEWPYLRVIVYQDDMLAMDLLAVVYHQNDEGIGRGTIVEMVKSWEDKWGIKEPLALPAPTEVQAPEPETVAA